MASDFVEHKHTKMDLLGMILSFACAIHCMCVPFLLGVLPSLGLGVLADHQFEYFMMGTIFIVGGIAFFRGFMDHKRKIVFAFYVVGLLVFLVIRPQLPHSHSNFGLETVATVFGGVAFMVGHWLNWRWSRSCACACVHS